MNDNDIFQLLDKIRQFGSINMYEAPAVLRLLFGFSKEESLRLFKAWQEYFTNKKKADWSEAETVITTDKKDSMSPEERKAEDEKWHKWIFGEEKHDQRLEDLLNETHS